MSDLNKLIADCIEAKPGNKEFALFYTPSEADNWTPWTAEIGNPVPPVMLGEASGEVQAEGKTPKEAVTNLLAALRPT